MGSSDAVPTPISTSLQASKVVTTTKSDDEPATKIVLKSKKMKSIKDLLVAKKLNTQAISLLMCAQSQEGKRHSSRDTVEPESKRTRRNTNKLYVC